MRKPKNLLPWIALVVGVTALISACASSDSSPAKIETVRELIGTWESGAGFHHFGEDGTHRWAKTAVMLERRMAVEPEGEYWFEDGYHFQAGKTCADNPGVYEIQKLEDGRIQFSVIEEGCLNRELWLVGNSSEALAWTRVD